MLRAGLVRQLTAGVYSWLPIGLRVLRKVEQIVRDELNASGAQELLMPIIQPAELWQESGRWDSMGAELFRLNDRHQRAFCLSPTHEEVITDIIRHEISSYRQLPVNLYQIATKHRDEVRPRFGVLRTREFLMMDAYSFHVSEASLQETYDEMYDSYARIFTRMGLTFQVVQADSGNIGGRLSHEFQALAAHGEDVIAVSDAGDYAANLELAACPPPAGATRPPPGEALEQVATPGVRTIDDVVAFLEVPIERTVKTLIVRGTEAPMVALILRGDHRLNATKAVKHESIASPLEFVSADEVARVHGLGFGSIGPCDLPMPCIADHAAALLADFMCGANREGFHYSGANWERDAALTDTADLREIAAGDPAPEGAGRIKLLRGIEVGHIFQLGRQYAEVLSAKVQDDKGKETAMTMGCYGIGVTRLVAAIIEQHHDDQGIVWPLAVAPFQVVLVALNYQKSEAVREVSDRLYETLVASGVEVLLDDRDFRPGAKLTDAELIGIPFRVVIGARSLKQDQVELVERRTNQEQQIPVAEIAAVLRRELATKASQ